MENNVNYVEKAMADYTRFIGAEVVKAKMLHSGRQNTIITIKDARGDRSCVRYRTAVEFWYEDCIKEQFIESLKIVDIPVVRFEDDTARPQILISEFVDGWLLHEIRVDKETAYKIGNVMANYHISANEASTYMDFVNGKKSSEQWVDEFIRSLEEEATACGYYKADINELAKRCKAIFPSDTQKTLVLVHNDFHFKNLIARPNGTVCVIDWDSAIIAPREKDFVKLLDWSHENLTVVPNIITAYQNATGYKLNLDAIDVFRIYTCLRQIHFQNIAAQKGVDNAVLLQKGFFGDNQKQHQRMCELINDLGLPDWCIPNNDYRRGSGGP